MGLIMRKCMIMLDTNTLKFTLFLRLYLISDTNSDNLTFLSSFPFRIGGNSVQIDYNRLDIDTDPCLQP